MTLLFSKEILPRSRKPRVMMRVIDAGNGCGVLENGEHIVEFECWKCGHNDGWYTVKNVTEGRRGIPCPICN